MMTDIRDDTGNREPRVAGVQTARVSVLLVLGSGPAACGIPAAVVARRVNLPPPSAWRPVGPVALSPAVSAHLDTVVVPLLGRIQAHLGLAPAGLEFSVESPGAATAVALPTVIEGHSLDLAFFAAGLAALLDAPVAGDIACTGHIASADGRVTFVEHLPAKLQAAASPEAHLRGVVVPADDASVAALLPAERERVAAAIATARQHVRVTIVQGLSEVLPVLFTETALVLAALRRGCFEQAAPSVDEPGELAAVIRYVLGSGNTRFWQVLDQAFQRGDSAGVSQLLAARLTFAVRCRKYPPHFGARLQQSLASVPPATRRLKLAPPLVSLRVAIRAAQHAGPGDEDDAARLLEVVAGRGPAWNTDTTATDVAATESGTGEALLSMMVGELNDAALAERLDHALDEARGTFALPANRVASHDEFHALLSAFVLHLNRHAGGWLDDDDRDAIGAEALDLLEAAYRGAGGYRAALAEALAPVRGGLRTILDQLTAELKKQRRQKHVKLVLTRALRGLDPAARAELARALQARVHPGQPVAPSSVDTIWSPDDCEELVRLFVAGLDRLQEALRSR